MFCNQHLKVLESKNTSQITIVSAILKPLNRAMVSITCGFVARVCVSAWRVSACLRGACLRVCVSACLRAAQDGDGEELWLDEVLETLLPPDGEVGCGPPPLKKMTNCCYKTNNVRLAEFGDLENCTTTRPIAHYSANPFVLQYS